MTAPARKTAAKKTSARKTSAAVAARREVRGEKGKTATIKVPFRGETFEFALDKIANDKVFARQQVLAKFGGGEKLCDLLFEILGPVDSVRWIELMKPGDLLADVAVELMTAINKAGNVPNS